MIHKICEDLRKDLTSLVVLYEISEDRAPKDAHLTDAFENLISTGCINDNHKITLKGSFVLERLAAINMVYDEYYRYFEHVDVVKNELAKDSVPPGWTYDEYTSLSCWIDLRLAAFLYRFDNPAIMFFSSTVYEINQYYDWAYKLWSGEWFDNLEYSLSNMTDLVEAINGMNFSSLMNKYPFEGEIDMDVFHKESLW